MKPLMTGALAAFAVAAGVSCAEAHAYLVASRPANRAEVLHPLDRIRLEFSGKADALFSTVKLMNDRGAVLAETTQETASREMVLPAPSLQPGTYRIVYRVLSVDGDLVEGKLDFVFLESLGDRPTETNPSS